MINLYLFTKTNKREEIEQTCYKIKTSEEFEMRIIS